MPGLSAKVFRTYNASVTLEAELEALSTDVKEAEKVRGVAWLTFLVVRWRSSNPQERVITLGHDDNTHRMPRRLCSGPGAHRRGTYRKQAAHMA